MANAKRPSPPSPKSGSLPHGNVRPVGEPMSLEGESLRAVRKAGLRVSEGVETGTAKRNPGGTS